MTVASPEKVSPGGTMPPLEPQVSQLSLGRLVSLRTVAAALGRQRRFWLTIALAGLLIGVAVSVALPGKYFATSDLYLEHNPADDPTVDMANDVALLQTYVIAHGVVGALGLHETPVTFLGQYSGLAISDSVLQVTVEATSTAAAEAEANELDKVFLAKRASLFQSQNNAVVTALRRDESSLYSQDQTLTNEVHSAEAAGASPTSPGVSELTSEATADMTVAQQLVTTVLTDDETTASIIEASTVLSPAAPVHASKLKKLVTDSATGLVAGLAIGCGIVAFGALAFERVRSRDGIAKALGVPISVVVPRMTRPPLGRVWWLRRSLHRPNRSVESLVPALRAVVDSLSRPVRLAIVSIDSLEMAALTTFVLARSFAAEGMASVVVDVADEALLCWALGLRAPGVKVLSDGTAAPVTIEWPEPNTIAPGVARSATVESPATATGRDDKVTLLLVTLDPARGAAHLTAQVSDAIAVVTVGRSKKARLQAVGEMLADAGINLHSAVVVGADVDDDSLGRRPAPDFDLPSEVMPPRSVELAD